MPTLKLDGDARGAVKALQEVAAEEKKVGDAAVKAAGELSIASQKDIAWLRERQREQKAAASAAKQLEQAAAHIVRDNEGPQERYNRRIGELSKLFVAGRLSVDQMDTALKRYNADLHQTNSVQQSTFGEGAAEKAASYFAGMIGPGAVIGLATTAIRDYREELRALGQQMQGDRSGLGELAQMSGGDLNKMRSLVAESKQIFGKGATNTLGEAGHLLFSMESGNISDPSQRQLMIDLVSNGVIRDPKQFASSIAALRSAFPDLTPSKALSMGLIAGVPSPGDASEIVAHTAKSGQQLKVLGWSPAFGLAAESILSRDFGGASEGGTRLEQMLKHIEHEGFATDPTLRGQDPFTVLKKISAGGLGEQNLSRYVGNRTEAMQGVRSLVGNMDLLQQLAQQAQSGDETLVRNVLGVAQQTPEINSARQAIASRNVRANSRMGSANTQQLYEAYQDEVTAGRGAFGSMAAKIGFGLRGWTEAGQEHELQKLSAAGAQGPVEGISKELLESINRHLSEINQKTAVQMVPVNAGRQER